MGHLDHEFPLPRSPAGNREGFVSGRHIPCHAQSQVHKVGSQRRFAVFTRFAGHRDLRI